MATFFKVVVLGDGGIGKTSICNYLTTGEFFGSYKLSIGADFFSKKLVVEGEEVSLQICDIGGQDQFAEISNIFTKGAHGAILCYDTTRRDTLDSLDRWIGKLEDQGIPKVLVSTKNDVEELREILDEEGLETAKRMNIPYYIPTTSLKGIGITETFEAISKLMLLEKKGMTLPSTEMIDVTHPKQPELQIVSGSQHISAQPLGLGRVPSEENYQPPTAPMTPDIALVAPPVVEDTNQEQPKPSFTERISLTPPTTDDTYSIEPPTEPEKTATQPISSITPPVSHQPEIQTEQIIEDQQSFQPFETEEEPKESEEEPIEVEKSSFSFLDRLREERKKLLDETEE
ncbi:MAG: GTP-binding protein [Candidatus Thorarchaeota archaeon]